MAPRISSNLRECIIIWYYDQNQSVEDIIKLTCRSKATIYRILATFEEFGQVTNPHSRLAGRKCTLLSTDLLYILGLLNAQLSLYLDEIQERLVAAHHIQVLLPTISRTLRRLAITNKSVT